MMLLRFLSKSSNELQSSYSGDKQPGPRRSSAIIANHRGSRASTENDNDKVKSPTCKVKELPTRFMITNHPHRVELDLPEPIAKLNQLRSLGGRGPSGERSSLIRGLLGGGGAGRGGGGAGRGGGGGGFGLSDNLISLCHAIPTPQSKNMKSLKNLRTEGKKWRQRKPAMRSGAFCEDEAGETYYVRICGGLGFCKL